MKPAPYPNNYAEEIDAISTFDQLLNHKIVIPHLNRLDKIPNTDGHLDLLDEEKRPIGKIEVQVRKIPDGETSYQCPLELVAYSEKISSPFLLVCVDVGNKRAYFRHLQRGILPELKPEQQSFVIKFDPKVHLVSGETHYFRQWVELVQEYNKRVSD